MWWFGKFRTWGSFAGSCEISRVCGDVEVARSVALVVNGLGVWGLGVCRLAGVAPNKGFQKGS